jgi:hypothetical protein
MRTMSGFADPADRRTGSAIKRRVGRGRPRAGRALRASLNQALRAASCELGARLEFSETEMLTIDRAADAADAAGDARHAEHFG